jgi:hypothetical protein
MTKTIERQKWFPIQNPCRFLNLSLIFFLNKKKWFGWEKTNKTLWVKKYKWSNKLFIILNCFFFHTFCVDLRVKKNSFSNNSFWNHFGQKNINEFLKKAALNQVQNILVSEFTRSRSVFNNYFRFTNF